MGSNRVGVNNGPLEVFAHLLRSGVTTVWKRRRVVVIVAWLFAVLSAVGVLFVPTRYEATARVYVDTQTALKPLMSGLTFQPDIDQQVRMLARTLIARPNVERLVDEAGLGSHEFGSGSREDVVRMLMEQIKVERAGAENLYQVKYRGKNPELAQRIVAATVDLFVKSGVGAKKRDSQDAGRFIEDQIRTYEAKLTAAENRLKEFKVSNFGTSGVSNKDYFTRISILTDEVGKLRMDLSAADRRRDALRRELNTEEPLLPIELAPAPNKQIADVEGRLEAQRKRLDELLQRFTDLHPDVVSTKRIIQELEADAAQRRRAEAESVAKLGPSRKAATSPVYQSIRVAQAEAEGEAESLRAQLQVKQAALAEARAAAGRLPQVEAELAQLNRDYEIIRTTYDQMVARREAAALGSKLDESSQLAEFRLIEPAKVSQSPVFPSQVHVAAFAILATIVVAIGAAIATDRLHPTVDSARTLRQLSDRPVIGQVSLLVSGSSAGKARAKVLVFLLLIGTLLAVQAGWAAWIAMKTYP